MKISGPWLKDEHGRTRMLRGVNLGGSSKVPAQPDGATHRRDGFFDHQQVSFVGRPFPMRDAEKHFARLRHWGFNCLRFIITWEAIEHAGPGNYDEAYLDYVREVVALAGDFGLQVIIDPHQDMWSRFSGGDGAPGWTLASAGFDLHMLHETGAAFLHQMHEGPLPRMIWPTNASKLACATMFTLFFGGNDFAPHTFVDGEPVQEYLQRHYLAAMGALAERMRDLPHVLGYGAMNEPLSGYIGQADLASQMGLVQSGASPTPYQGMLLGAGYSQEVPYWEQGFARTRQRGKRMLNAQGVSAWLSGRECVWRENGVWDVEHDGRPRLLRPSHFAAVDGRAVDFNRDYYKPFLRRFAQTVRERHPDCLLFVEPALANEPPSWTAADPPNVVYTPHWYDVFVLFTKSFSPYIALDPEARRVVFTPPLIRRSFVRQLGRSRSHAAQHMGGAPTLIGETGIAFDLRNGKALASGDFALQTRALERTFSALEANMLSYALWNYTPDNENGHGDQWNGENLSIFGLDQQQEPQDINSGGRALAAVIRPYAMAIAGEPLSMHFDLGTRRYELRFRHTDEASAATILFVPHFHYGKGYDVTISDGRVTRDEPSQQLIYHHDPRQAEHTLIVTPVPRA